MKTMFSVLLLLVTPACLAPQTIQNGTDAATVDSYGHMQDVTFSGVSRVEYGSSFMAVNGGAPAEVVSGSPNVSVYAGDPAPPAGVSDFYFLPARFEDWTYGGAPDAECHAITLFSNGPDERLVLGLGYKLIGNGYDLVIANQGTNVGNATITVKPFVYYRTRSSFVPLETSYDNGYDGLTGTSDDVIWANSGTRWTYFFAGYPIAHYRIQAYAAGPASLYNSMTTGGSGYDLTNATSTVSGQSELAYQYSEVTLESGQAVLNWLYPKPIKVWNTTTNYPTNFVYDVDTLTATGTNTFAGTDVSMDHTALTFVPGLDPVEMRVTVAEITGGMIEGNSGALNVVLHNRYWEIFYDTRRSASTANITFNYDPAVDGIIDETVLTLAYRTDYGNAWTEWGNVGKDIASNTLTAVGVSLGDAQWALAYNDVPLPVQATAFAARTADQSVTLTWETRSEVNNAGFEVLRQDPDSDSFTLIASYKSNNALKGLGTSTSGRSYTYTDGRVQPGLTYQYMVQSVSTSGEINDVNTLTVTVAGNTPKEYALSQNYPNPFNPTTTIVYEIPSPGPVSLKIYDVFGREVRTLVNEVKKAGRYEVKCEISDLASGVYFYKIKTGAYAAVKKMLLVK